VPAPQPSGERGHEPSHLLPDFPALITGRRPAISLNTPHEKPRTKSVAAGQMYAQ